MSIPEIEFLETGLKIPSEQDILNALLQEFNLAFGGGLNFNLDTPQGQLASSLTAIINDKNNQIAYLINQMNPNYAQGFMLDAISKIYFIKRKQSTNSSVICDFIGLQGVVIPKGFIVKDTSGNEWRTVEQGIIGENGKASIELESGIKAKATAGEVNNIIKIINGLDRVYNPLDSVDGVDTESDYSLRQRRAESVAINSTGNINAVYSRLFELKNVRDVFVIDNPQNEPRIIGGLTLKPHSIYCCVYGGSDEEIAKTIFKYTGNGCDYNGNKTVIVKDENYSEPAPEYSISFQRPSNINLIIKVYIANNANYNVDEQIKTLLVEHFNNKGFSKIGATIYALNFVSELQKIENLQVLDIKVGANEKNLNTSTVAKINQRFNLNPENILIVR